MTAFSDHPQSRPATGWPLVVRQTTALFGDAVRRLRAAKLFWIALALSALVGGVIGVVGIDDTGWSVPFFGHVNDPVNNTTIQPAEAFYRWIFIDFGVAIWLAYGATLLGLVSTASLIPSLIDEGSVDLYLSRPLGRIRLLLTRYATGLLFVAAQALCFAVVAIAVFAVRAGVFLPDLLWCVVYTTLLFSFLYCVSALVGLLSGNTLAALLATGLLWAFVFAVDWAEFGVLFSRETNRVSVELAEQQLARAEVVESRFNGPNSTAGEAPRAFATTQRSAAADRLADAEESLATTARIHQLVYWIKAPFPKLGETNALMRRHLIDAATVDRVRDAKLAENEANVEASVDGNDRITEQQKDEQRGLLLSMMRGGSAASEAYGERSLWWSIGTGLAFEGIVVLLCCVIFWRRDLA